MARTKMIARIVAEQRRQAARAVAAAAAANKPGPSNQRRRRQPKQRIGIKNIEERIRGTSFKIKRLTAQQGNIDVKKKKKKNDIVVRKMVVRRRTIFPAKVKRAYY